MQTSLLAENQQIVSPLPAAQLSEFSRLIQQLNPQQLSWASGYLTGLSLQTALHIPTASSSLTVLYSSHTGNGKALAQKLADSARSSGLTVRVLSASEYKPRDIAKEELLSLIISTHGEGEPPESALELYNYIFSKRAPELKQLQYSIFALGDSSYEYFCKAGQDFDEQLEKLGAKKILNRVDADISYQAEADDWIKQIIDQSSNLLPSSGNVISLPHAVNSVIYNRDNPYKATVLESRRITTTNSIADVRHLELSIDPELISYKPGDSLGLWAHNDPELVTSIINQLNLDAKQTLNINEEELSIEQLLLEKVELTLLHPSVIKKWAALANSIELSTLIEDRTKLNQFVQQHQFIDLISLYPANSDPQTLAALLQPIQPRLYSISSSQQASDDEVHLTVSALRYSQGDEIRKGTASNYLTERVVEDQQVSVYVVENELFRLPEDNATPIIMIGAGTGIAPYRAFLQQREELNASGKNWLVFGNRHFHRDFLYQTDWQSFKTKGLLDRVSLAFSRDPDSVGYVQHKLQKEAAEIYQWINQGAVLYICGSTTVDQEVQKTLVDIFQQEGNLNADEAQQFLDQLRTDKRYLRDVY